LAISRSQKEQILDSYVKALAGAKGVIITEYRGFAMKNFNEMRKVLRPLKAKFAVTKTTLFKRALKDSGFVVPEDLLTGPIAVAIAHGELGTITKAILARKKDDDLLVLKGAIMGDVVFRGQSGLETLSTLPTLDEARASFIGLLQSPASQLLSLFSQPAQQMAQVLKAYTDQQQGDSAGAA
jgi:large subunit ribosomal protein L10